jgi:four helix bundle protein
MENKMATDYRELRVWQAAMDLAEAIYRYTTQLLGEERFGLVSRMRRAAVSVPSNIAEGNARISRGEYIQFLGMARGSLAELETQLLLAKRLGYATLAELMAQVTSTRKQLQALIRSLGK